MIKKKTTHRQEVWKLVARSQNNSSVAVEILTNNRNFSCMVINKCLRSTFPLENFFFSFLFPSFHYSSSLDYFPSCHPYKIKWFMNSSYSKTISFEMCSFAINDQRSFSAKFAIVLSSVLVRQLNRLWWQAGNLWSWAKLPSMCI